MVRPLVAEITPLISRIQVSMETSVPTCGAYPGFGPRILTLESAASAALETNNIPGSAENPAARAAEPFRKLLRLKQSSRLGIITHPPRLPMEVHGFYKNQHAHEHGTYN